MHEHIGCSSKDMLLAFGKQRLDRDRLEAHTDRLAFDPMKELEEYQVDPQKVIFGYPSVTELRSVQTSLFAQTFFFCRSENFTKIYLQSLFLVL